MDIQFSVRFTSSVKMVLDYANVWHGYIVRCQEVTELEAGLLMRYSAAVFSVGEVSSFERFHFKNLFKNLT